MVGEIAAIASAITWALANIAFARIPSKHSPLSIATLKSLLAAALCAATLLALEHTAWPTFDPRATLLLAASAVVGITLGDLIYLHTLVHLGARRTVFFSTLVPPASAAVAYVAFGESLSAVQILGMVLTLAGVTLVLYQRPGATAESLPPGKLVRGIALGLTVVALQVAANILTKEGAGKSSALAVSTVRLVFGSTGLLSLTLLGRSTRAVFLPLATPKTAGLVLFATLLGSYLGVWLYMAAIMYTEVGIAVTLSATSPIFITGLAHFFLGERATIRAFAGALISVAGVALLFAGAST